MLANMDCNEDVLTRVRKALVNTPNVKEKKMFGGITFMVNDKMCISVSNHRIMCRIDPMIHEEVTGKKGCQAVKMREREYKGYVYVSEDGIKTREDLDYWLGLALDFNKKVRTPRKK